MNRVLLKHRTHCQSSQLTPRDAVYRKWVDQYTFRELEKDVGRGDITAAVCFPQKRIIGAFVIAKEAGIFAGEREIEYFLRKFPGLKWKFLKHDGIPLKNQDIVLRMNGSVGVLMKVERVILNLLGRMSGVATTTNRFVQKAKKGNNSVLVTPTRKTLWGLLDKRACVLGGGGTHRLGLDNAVLIKHNHLKASRLSLELLLKNAISNLLKRGKSKPKFLEIEVRNKKYALEASRVLAQAKQHGFPLPCFVMLDNIAPREIAATIQDAKKKKLFDAVLFEASGRISEKNIVEYAKTGVDVLSIGAITHSAPMLDFSCRASGDERGIRSGRLLSRH